MRIINSSKWFSSMKDGLQSININKVYDLKVIPKGAKIVGYS
jgi:hypothetical protein